MENDFQRQKTNSKLDFACKEQFRIERNIEMERRGWMRGEKE